jgi:thiaminase/transcriptional activator TenA
MGRLSFFSQQLYFVSKLLKINELNTIYNHKFNQQLFDGTLSPEAFGKYLHDDYIYLHHYTGILGQLSNRAQNINNNLSQHLNSLAHNIVINEKEMQNHYSKYFTNTPESKPGKAISEYLDFLREHAMTSDLPVALCSILPCFWIYAKLGSITLKPDQLDLNPYKGWIETYSDKKFVEATKILAETINQLGIKANEETQKQMTVVFNKAVKFELEFFDEIEPNQVCALVG